MGLRGRRWAAAGGAGKLIVEPRPYAAPDACTGRVPQALACHQLACSGARPPAAAARQRCSRCNGRARRAVGPHNHCCLCRTLASVLAHRSQPQLYLPSRADQLESPLLLLQAREPGEGTWRTPPAATSSRHALWTLEVADCAGQVHASACRVPCLLACDRASCDTLVRLQSYEYRIAYVIVLRGQ